MSKEPEEAPYHGDEKRFRDALTHTAAVTGFSERLIEKDYYCSVLLRDFGPLFGQGLVFKGGTCLSKIHVDFFRLSEDLDFGISLKTDATRGQRRQAIGPVKDHFAGVISRLPFFAVAVDLTGWYHSIQYNGQLAYQSVVTGEPESIKVEVSLREEVLIPNGPVVAKTLLIDPLTSTAAMSPIEVSALSLREAYAEKTRAALTRRSPAIRDLFDLYNAARNGHITHSDASFIELVVKKLAATEDRADLSPERVIAFREQLETQLKPVLKPSDYSAFVLDEVVGLLQLIHKECGRSG
jgi:predicted nucleotidyltransferase component of viral defense system